MKRSNIKVIGGILLVAILLVAVGYAAISNVGLKISGTATSKANQSNFVVEMIGTPTTSGDGTTVATINESKKTEGTMTVSGLNAKGETATAVYTVKNQSQDLSADLTAKATSTNDEYFEVQCSLDKTTLKAQEETTMTVKVKLLKTPIDETKENLTTKIGVNIEAEPKQPGEEVNGGATTVTSKTEKPYLPTGFTEIAGTTVEKGYSIQDSTGNQYVWVEVPKTNDVYLTAGLNIKTFSDEEYNKIEADLHTYTKDYREDEYDDLYIEEEDSGLKASGLTSEQYYALKKKMLKSVYQKGGFYIGKYETGVEGDARTYGSNTENPTETPIIKQNVHPYTYITNSQAQALATNMESGNCTTSLLFGVQWDLVLKYLETKGTSQDELKTDSISWANYNHPILVTGSDEKYSKQGIYNLAGNVQEFTLEEHQNNSPCVRRGGSFIYLEYHNDESACTRSVDLEDIMSDDIGFRVALY